MKKYFALSDIFTKNENPYQKLLNDYPTTNPRKALLNNAISSWNNTTQTNNHADKNKDVTTLIELLNKVASSVSFNDGWALYTEINNLVRIKVSKAGKGTNTVINNRVIDIVFDFISNRIVNKFQAISRVELTQFILKAKDSSGNPTEFFQQSHSNNGAILTKISHSRAMKNEDLLDDLISDDKALLNTLERRDGELARGVIENKISYNNLISYLILINEETKLDVTNAKHQTIAQIILFCSQHKFQNLDIKTLLSNTAKVISTMNMGFIAERANVESKELEYNSTAEFLLKAIYLCGDGLDTDSESFRELLVESIIRQRAIQITLYCNEVFSEPGNRYEQNVNRQFERYTSTQFICATTWINWNLAHGNLNQFTSFTDLVSSLYRDVVTNPICSMTVNNLQKQKKKEIGKNFNLEEYQMEFTNEKITSLIDLSLATTHFRFSNESELLSVLKLHLVELASHHEEILGVNRHDFYQKVKTKALMSVLSCSSQTGGELIPPDRDSIDKIFSGCTQHTFEVLKPN